MALAVHHNLPIAHADIPQAFVQSVLKRPIYCKFPQGVEICPKLLAHVQAKHPNARIGMKLLKSLYGLKNAPMYWSLLLNQHRASQDLDLSDQKVTPVSTLTLVPMENGARLQYS